MIWLIQQQLKSKSPQLRYRAVQQLRRTVGETALLLLIRSLQTDTEALVRSEAAGALGLWKDPRAVEALMAALQDTQTEVQSAAIESLRRLGDGAAVAPLAALLKSGAPVLKTEVAQALQALGWQPKEEELQAVFLVALGDLDRAAILGKVAIGPLSEALRQGTYQKRVKAVHRLAEIGDPSAVEPLLAAVGDPDGLVRAAVANALGQLGDARVVGQLAVLLKDRDPNVRAAAAGALGVVGDQRAVEPLVRMAGDPHWEVRAAVLEALGRLRDPRASDALATGLRDADREVRERAAEALGRLGDSRAIGPLLTAALDAESTVRQASLRALQRLNPFWYQSAEARDNIEVVRACARQRDYGIQLTAMDILRRMGETPTPAAGVAQRPTETGVVRRRTGRDVLVDLLADRQAELRQAAVEGLARLREPSLAELLGPLRDDPDPSVRLVARGVSRLASSRQTPA